jgi:hypothetical protein
MRLLSGSAKYSMRMRSAYAVSYEAAAQRYAPFLSAISQVRVRLLPRHGCRGRDG